MNSTDLKLLAQDLTNDYPRSPRETPGGFVIAARTLGMSASTEKMLPRSFVNRRYVDF